MKRFHRCTGFLLAALGAGLALACASPDPAREPVSYANLYERERYWPYHVRLTGSWKPEGFEGERFSWGLGVLIRVEPSGALRIDFARHGRHEVPARATDVLERANRIRRGEERKGQPNFVLAAVNKLLDPSRDPIRYLSPATVGRVRAYLIVAADPAAPDFPGLAADLAALAPRPELLPVLFPQGGHAPEAVLELCREAGWDRPFLFPRFAAPFTASIFGEAPTLPGFVLQSPEGRVMRAGRWGPEAPGALRAALSRELGEAGPPGTDTAS